MTITAGTGPPDTRPPGHPPPSPPPKADTQTPARRIQPLAGSIATNGGPARPPTREVGEEPTPGSTAAVILPAVGESGQARQRLAAGASFRLPPTPPLPRFDEGEHRLVGRVTHP